MRHGQQRLGGSPLTIEQHHGTQQVQDHSKIHPRVDGTDGVFVAARGWIVEKSECVDPILGYTIRSPQAISLERNCSYHSGTYA
jgi:hypothetical protein